MIILNSKQCGSYRGFEHPESPERISGILRLLEKENIEVIYEDILASEEELLLVHSPEHLDRLKNSVPEDPDCPIYPNMFQYASLSAGSAIHAGELSLSRESTFSLMRPPGHHASKNKAMGFCYLNNAALAAVYLKNKNKKVAILDIDNHHGNGTQEIVYGLKNILFVDLHNHPAYPGTGMESKSNCINFLLKPQIGEDGYLAALDRALERIQDFAPSVLVVSAGFDGYYKDPLGNLGLHKASYERIGQKIKSLEVPVCSVLEGGYNTDDLPECVLRYIKGLES